MKAIGSGSLANYINSRGGARENTRTPEERRSSMENYDWTGHSPSDADLIARGIDPAQQRAQRESDRLSREAEGIFNKYANPEMFTDGKFNGPEFVPPVGSQPHATNNSSGARTLRGTPAAIAPALPPAAQIGQPTPATEPPTIGKPNPAYQIPGISNFGGVMPTKGAQSAPSSLGNQAPPNEAKVGPIGNVYSPDSNTKLLENSWLKKVGTA